MGTPDNIGCTGCLAPKQRHLEAVYSSLVQPMAEGCKESQEPMVPRDFWHKQANSLRFMGRKYVIAKPSWIGKIALMGSDRVFLCGSNGQLLSFWLEQSH